MKNQKQEKEKKMTTRKERQTIQDYYGCNVIIKIKRNGEVHYYGSQDAFDRRNDYWHYGGEVAEILDRAEAKCQN